MENKNIVRVEKNKNYTIINNTSLYDERLSWKAKAIHAFMLSKPDDWTFYNEEMIKWATDGNTSFDSGLRELKKYGYVKKEKRRGNDGKFEWVTVVYEVPQIETNPEKPKEQQKEPYPEKPPMGKPHMGNPSMGNPRVEKPFVENQGLINTNTPSTDSLSTNALNNNDDDMGPAYVTSEKQTAPPTQNAFAFYEQNHFGALGALIANKIDNWINDMSEPIVIHAMEKAVMNGKTNWGYVETILKDWWNKKLFTLEAIEAEDLRWRDQRIKATQQQNRPQRNYQKPRREEVVPEWFKDRNTDSAPRPAEPEPPEPIDFEAERQRILAKLDGGYEKHEQSQKNS